VLGNYGVDVINLSTDRVVATVPLSGAEAIAAAPNGSAIYVTTVSWVSARVRDGERHQHGDETTITRPTAG